MTEATPVIETIETSKEDTVKETKNATPTVITLTIPKFDGKSIRTAINTGVQKAKEFKPDFKKVGENIVNGTQAVKNIDHQKGRKKFGNFIGAFGSAIDDIKTGMNETIEKNKNNLSK